TARRGLLPQAEALLSKRLAQIVETRAQFDPRAINELKSDVSVLRMELEAARRRHQLTTLATVETGNAAPKRSDRKRPFVVVVAGVPRSGSTWVYNAVRALCRRSKETAHSVWVDEYDPAAKPDAAFHIVKLHNSQQLTFPHDVVITSYRDLIERVASLVRMGWVERDAAAIVKAASGQAQLHAYWAGRSHLELQYRDIMGDPVKPLGEIAGLLGLKIYAKGLEAVAKELNNMASPAALKDAAPHDAKTLMHVNHRGEDQERDTLVTLVRNALSSAPLT
ncbi:MAG: hypothetical protein AAFR53_01055, partial [Pseudomonadota bacterium]